MSSSPPELTEVFTPSSTCYQSTYGAEVTTLTSANGIYFVLGDPSQVEGCLPSALGDSTVPFFSPGLYCPQDWTTACSTTSDGIQIATCCPPGGYACETESSKSDLYYWLTLYPCISYVGAEATTATAVPIILTSPSTSTVDYSLAAYDAINAPGIDLRVDATAVTSSTPASSATDTDSANDISSTTGTDSVIGTSSAASGHKSSNQALKIGLGVGISLAAVGAAMLGAAIWFFRRSRKRDKSPDAGSTETAWTGENGFAGTPEVEGRVVKPTIEVDGTPRTRVFEMENSQARAELPTQREWS